MVAIVTSGGIGIALLAGIATARMAVRAYTPRPDVEVANPRLPVLPTLPDAYEGIVLARYLEDPDDALLRSQVLRDPDFTRAVHDWVGYWTGPATRWFPGFLERMAARGPSVDSALYEAELPPSLRYLPLIESGYDPRVTSSASAVGLWQLMSGTAQDLGLEVNPILDERRNAEQSTDAALRYIRSLHDDFGSWFVVLAAYNSGGGRVRGIFRAHAPGEPPTDSLFWALREHFPRETREFLPKLFGAMWVASRPEAYGYNAPTVELERTEAVVVDRRTTLDVVALAAGVSYSDVWRLNPEFLRGVTPRDRVVTVLVPEGRARTFRRIYPRLRPEDRIRFIEHEVRPGETLSIIAARYGIEVVELRAENPRLEPRALGVGARVTVPVALPVDSKDSP